MTILVDMDDTMTDLCGAWCAWLNKKHATQVQPEDIKEWDMAVAFPHLTEDALYEPFRHKSVWRTVKPKPGARTYLKRLVDDGHEVYIVTATDYRSIKWKFDCLIRRYFPFVPWSNLIVASKKQMVRGDVLLDDGVHNLMGGAYRKLLMDAPHNRAYDAEENGMRRVWTWEEAYRMIAEINKEQETL